MQGNDPITEVLEDLLKLDDVLACMIARQNMISVIPDTNKFDPQVMQVWDIIKNAMDSVFGVIQQYSMAGLEEMEFQLQEYETLFYIFPDTENALVAIIPALSNKGLIEVELENARREIITLLDDGGPAVEQTDPIAPANEANTTSDVYGLNVVQ